MHGGSEHLGRRATLDDPTEVHDADAVRDAADDTEVVRDHEGRELVLVLQVSQQVQDLRLDRHVQRGDGFVEDQQAWLQDEGSGDDHALALAAAEFAGAAVRERGVQADRCERGGHVRKFAPLDHRRFDQRLADREAR